MKALIIVTLSSFLPLIFASEGKNIVSQTCLGCHSDQSKAAPSLKNIHDRYLKINKNTQHLYQSFLQDTAKNYHLKEYVNQFGLMPQLTLSNKEITSISKFLSLGVFKNLVESTNTPKDPLKKGKFIASSTKSQLGKKLLAALKTKGSEGAVTFCNTKALPITYSKNNEFKVRIKRATDKPRNGLNKADKEELKYITLFKEQLKTNTIKPQLVETKDEFHFYSPIKTNKMCMQCHGDINEKEISDKTYNRIKKLYPNDKAINYKPNQIRGVFSIRWKK